MANAARQAAFVERDRAGRYAGDEILPVLRIVGVYSGG